MLTNIRLWDIFKFIPFQDILSIPSIRPYQARSNMTGQHATEEQEKQPDVEKRDRIKGLVAGGVLTAAGSAVWSKPVVNSLILPAHAQTSPPPDTEFAPADAAEFHARFNTALRTPGNWRKHFSFDTQRTLELSPDGTTAIEKRHDRDGNPITDTITYDAGWTYRKTGPNAGTLFLMDNPSDCEFDRTLHLTFESPRSGSARYVEYEPNPDPNEVYDYTKRFDW